MKKYNRNLRHRRSIYRKNSIFVYLLIALCAVLAIVVVFVLVGNALGKKAEADESGNKDSTNNASDVTERPLPLSVNSGFVQLSVDNSRLSDRLSGVSTAGYNAACFELDSKNGDVLYSSDVAVSMGYLPSNSGLWELDDVASLFDSHGLYSIGVSHLSRLNTDNDLRRSLAIGYYAAQTAEAIRAGIDDVLLRPDGIPVERYSELVDIAHKVHELCPDGTVGVAVPVSVLTSESASSVVDLLWSEFNYIAVDLTSAPEENETEVQKIDRELGGILYYLLRYNLRVLVPYTDDTSLATEIANAVRRSGSQNIQVIPQ